MPATHPTPTRLGPSASEGTRALLRAIERLGWSQRELARQLGTSSGLVNKWLRGVQTPGLDWAHRIQALAGVDPLLWTRPLKRKHHAA